MKTISRTIQRFGAGSVTALVVALLVGAPSFALTSTPAQTTQGSEARCARFATLAGVANTKMSERIAAMEVDFQKRLSIISGRHDAVDQKVATSRTAALDKFDLKVTELKSKTGLTTEQSTAIDAFVTSMKEAQAARAQAVDSARATYRAALSEEITAHQARLLQAALVFQRSVSAAFTKAQANCAESTANDVLRNEIKTARDIFQTARKAEVTGSSVKQLAETRRTAIKAANEEFVKKAKEYTATLKTALETTK